MVKYGNEIKYQIHEPEALLLADALDNYADGHNCNEKAAAELRRLQDINIKLIEVLQETLCVLENEGVTFWSDIQDKARTLLTIAEGN